MQETRGERYHVIRWGGGETTVCFNYQAVSIDTKYLQNFSRRAFVESGGRIIVDCEKAEHGIIKIYENLAMGPGAIGINSVDEVINSLTGQIDRSTIY